MPQTRGTSVKKKSKGTYVQPILDGETHSVVLAGEKKVLLEPHSEFLGVTFDQVDLSGLSLTSCKFSDCLFVNCKIEFTEFSHSQFTNTKFSKSNLLGSVFLWANMVDVTVHDCNVDNARYNFGNLENCL